MTSTPAQPSEHSERAELEEPLSPADSLALIDTQRRSTQRQLRPNPLGLFLPWGLAYLIAFGAIWLNTGPRLLPDAVTIAIVAVSFVGAVACGITTLVRSFRGVAGPSQATGRLYGWSWPLGFAALGVSNGQLDALGVPPPVIALVWSSSALIVVGLLMLTGGLLWPGSGQYPLGVWILISGALSMLVGYPTNFLVLSLAGGGGFIVLAVVAWWRQDRHCA